MADFDMRIRIVRVLDPEELGEQIEPKVANLGRAMGARAQRLVPKKTYALHDTIKTETTRSAARVVTTVTAGGGKVGYAMYVERGTSRMAAQPYLRPALHQSTPADLRYSGEGPIARGIRATRTSSSRRERVAARRADAKSKGVQL